MPRVAVFVPEKPVELPDGGTLHFTLKQMHGGWNSDDNMNNNLGRFRLSVTDAAKPDADPLPPLVRAALAVPSAKRTPAQAQTVFGHWRTTVLAFAGANAEIEALWKEWPEGDTSLIAAPRDEPRPTSILKRGDFLRPARRWSPACPRFCTRFPKTPIPAG